MREFSLKELGKRVENVLDDLDRFAHSGGVFHFVSGRESPMTGRAFCRLCSACVRHSRAGELCRQAAIGASYRSLSSGDTCAFNCWLGLRALTIPVSPDGDKILGALEIGGILLKGELQKRQHEIMKMLSSVGAEDNLQNFVNAFQGADEMPEINIEHLSAFLKESLFSNGLLDPVKFKENNQFWLQQKRISENLRYMKSGSKNLRREMLLAGDELMSMLASRKSETEMNSKVDEILSVMMLAEPDNIVSSKALIAPILAMLSAESVKRGKNWSKTFAINAIRMEELEKISTFKELCSWFSNIISRGVAESSVKNADEETLSSKIISWINANYSRKAPLSDVAKAVAASPSSVMHKLKAETGMTFSETLNTIRVKEAKRLLAFTSLPLGEISLRCGFRDQSYFTKIFQKLVNIGPREFRKMLNSTENKA